MEEEKCVKQDRFASSTSCGATCVKIGTSAMVLRPNALDALPCFHWNKRLRRLSHNLRSDDRTRSPLPSVPRPMSIQAPVLVLQDRQVLEDASHCSELVESAAEQDRTVTVGPIFLRRLKVMTEILKLTERSFLLSMISLKMLPMNQFSRHRSSHWMDHITRMQMQIVCTAHV